jgi:hypothetical protein
MAFYDSEWYISSVAYAAVTPWAASSVVAAGVIRRQLTTPAVGSERCFICIVAGTTGSTEPTWVVTRGAKQPTDNGVIWQECTGSSAVNGDQFDTTTWNNAKAIGTPTLGAIIQRNSGASFQICTTAGTLSVSEPGFSNTAGATTADGTTVWTCIGTSFSTWAAPHARMLNACTSTWGAINNDFWAADNHNETTGAALSLSGVGSGATPCRFFSIDHTQTLPAASSSLKPGATITCSIAVANSFIIISGNNFTSYWYGFNFIASGALAGSMIALCNGGPVRGQYESCTFQLTGGTSGSIIVLSGATGQGTAWLELVNCTFGFSNAGQFLDIGGGLLFWKNTADPCFTGTIPNPAIKGSASTGFSVLIESVDLTSVGSGTLFYSIGGGQITLKNCKLGTGPIIQTPTISSAAMNVDVANCDSGTAVYRNERHNICGDLTTSAQVVRTGGATDGTTPVSHFIAPSTFTRSWRPFTSLPLMIWNDVVGTSRTVTIYGASTGASLPLNSVFWIEVQYMGSTGSPNASVVSTGLANQLTTPTTIAVTDTSAWDSAAPARANSHLYAVGNIIKTASNPGRLFYCTLGGTTASSEPGGFAGAIDGSVFSDGASFIALTRFSLTATFTAQQHGYITVYPKFGSGALSISFFIDPLVVLV